MDKRTFLKASALFGAGALISLPGVAKLGYAAPSRLVTSGLSAGDEFILPPLPYPYNALEPYIDAQTMELHHDKHHAAYTANLNKAVVAEHLQGKSIEELIVNVSNYSAAIRNQGGGYYNHLFFWDTLSPKGGLPDGALADAINRNFGSFQNFKDELSKKTVGVFGSGWGWLMVEARKLKTTTTANQDNPLMDVVAEKGIPLLNIDVWEHAYYLKYQYKRKDYVDAIWNVINWPKVAERFAAASIQV